MEQKPLLKASTQTFQFGSKTLGLYRDSYTDKKGVRRESYILGEVEAVPDPMDRTRIGGWKPRYGGQRLQAEPAVMEALLLALSRGADLRPPVEVVAAAKNNGRLG